MNETQEQRAPVLGDPDPTKYHVYQRQHAVRLHAFERGDGLWIYGDLWTERDPTEAWMGTTHLAFLQAENPGITYIGLGRKLG